MASMGVLLRCDAAAAQLRSSSRGSGHGAAGSRYPPAPLQQHTPCTLLGGSAALTTGLGAGRGLGRRRSSSTHSSSTSVVTASQQVSSSAGTKSSEYNRTMKEQMGWAQLDPYEYHYERGLYYHEVSPNLICGSQPRNAEDVAYLKREESVTTVLNLQQDKDLQHWGVKLDQLQAACKHHGIELIRRPARDFDPHSLRKTLPSAVSALHEAVANNGRVYVHCTAGLGRAPAVCIAYLYWFRGMQLDEAYKHLTDIRPCGPKKDAVRGATYDCLSTGDFLGFDRLPREAFASLSAEDRYVLQYRILKGAV